MTQEELEKKAEEYAEKQSGVFRTIHDHIKLGYIAGAKENRVVWHDLRKNPNDLPQKVGDYIVAIKFKYLKGCDTTILRYDEDEDEDKLCWIDSEYTNCNDDVIAWCEIPKFRVESK